MANEFTARKGITILGGTSDTAPIKINIGSNLTSPSNGSIEYFSYSPGNYDKIPCFTTNDQRHIFQLGIINYNDADIAKTNTTTLGTILSITIPSGSAYEIEVFCNITATTSFGMKGAMAITSGTAFDVSTYSNLFSGTSIISGTRTNGTSFGATEFSSTTTTSASFQLKGTIFPQSSCTLEFQGAQAAANAASTTFKKGCYIKATPIWSQMLA